eukprot:TRINITY_DN62303_c0_g2_i1.p1 TRINITY_DN62303_c0_g2~~TRINITY_DN62303_c0_g2_i1.p1  ORF type:complete len:458 (+),score=11.57 TRINITY_DN62303_c0_g2_i1:58-1431(+)
MDSHTCTPLLPNEITMLVHSVPHDWTHVSVLSRSVTFSSVKKAAFAILSRHEHLRSSYTYNDATKQWSRQFLPLAVWEDYILNLRVASLARPDIAEESTLPVRHARYSPLFQQGKPCIAVSLCTTPSGEQAVCVATVHLIVDGISSNLIQEQLQTAIERAEQDASLPYTSLLDNMKPARGPLAIEWVSLMKKYKHKLPLDYWMKTLPPPFLFPRHSPQATSFKISSDVPLCGVVNTYSELDSSVGAVLNKIKGVSPLAATFYGIIGAVHELTGRVDGSLMMFGMARSIMDDVAGKEIKTEHVGWFAAPSPVGFHWDPKLSPLDQARSIQQQRKQSPLSAVVEYCSQIGYTTGGKEVFNKFHSVPSITVNVLPMWPWKPEDGRLFSPWTVPHGHCLPKFKRNKVNLNVLLEAGGNWKLAWFWDPEWYSQQQGEYCASRVAQKLKELAESVVAERRSSL